MRTDHPMSHRTPDAYTRRREAAWKKAGIRFRGRFLTWRAFAACVELQRHRCAVCGMSDALESLQADHAHGVRGDNFRGALCRFDNQIGVGAVERYGTCRNERYTGLIRAYLSNPPASRLPVTRRR